MKPIPRVILATTLLVALAILVWRNRPLKPQPVLQTNVAPGSVTWELPADPVGAVTNVYYGYKDQYAHARWDQSWQTNAGPIYHPLFWPFTEIEDPWIDMDPSDVSTEELERWLNEKQEFILREAGEGLAEREALWEKIKAERKEQGQ